MKFVNKKTSASLISLLLIFTILTSMLALQTVNAHYPPWTIRSWSYVIATPNPVGVGQQVQVIWWADSYPQTALGDLGDRFTFTFYMTKPDGTNSTHGPFKSDPVGGGFMLLTPDQVGNYTFSVKLDPHVYTELTGQPARDIFVNDTYTGSTSNPCTLIVQEEPLQFWPSAPLPTEYWTRPIDAGLREWRQIAGNWLSDGRGNLNSEAPETAHIMWTKPINLGGIVGEPYGEISYYTGSSYEGAWVHLSESGSRTGRPALNQWFNAPVLMDGKLYYNQPAGHSILAGYKFVCVDLRTGEEQWEVNGTRLTFGWIYEYGSPNQSGGHGYLWADRNPLQGQIRGGTADIYNPLTGDVLFTITNVPPATPATFGVGPHGEPLIYTLNAGGWLSCWNASYIQTMTGAPLSARVSESWQWRPVGKIHDGNTGYVWNKTVPKNLGDINYVLPDRLLGSSNMASQYYSLNYSIWAISTKPGQEGQLLWKKDFAAPSAGEWSTERMQTWSLEDKVFCINNKETRTWSGYDLDTGERLWGPTAPQGTDFDMYYSGSLGYIAYGKLFSASYSGIVHAYDVKTGELLWTAETDRCGLEGPYERWPIGTGSGRAIADGKLYYTTSEHSVEHPINRGWRMYCFDAETGENLWNISSLGPGPAIADGYLVGLNYLNYQIHVYGKGPSATTVSASPKISMHGNRVLIEGMVTDISPGTTNSDLKLRFPNGVPAIADEDMTPWMEYVYHQHQKPTNAVGVKVTLDVIDANGNFRNIGMATSDASGFFSFDWKPDIEGKYTVIANFQGSKSYWPSQAVTAFVVEAAAPTPTAQPVVAQSPTEMYVLGIGVAIIIAIAIATLLIIKKRP